MADKLSTSSPKGKDFVRAFLDLLILALLLVCAAFGGYWYGIHERVIPVAVVPPGTANAHTEGEAQAAASAATPANMPAPSSSTPATQTAVTDAPAAEPAKTSKKKYWLYSSGKEYIGYSITVSVNDTQVDNFYGPGKIVDITDRMQAGENSIVFDAKHLDEEGYNKWKGKSSAQLVVQVVSGPKVSEDFNHSDVAASFARNATETEDISETKHVNVK